MLPYSAATVKLSFLCGHPGGQGQFCSSSFLSLSAVQQQNRVTFLLSFFFTVVNGDNVDNPRVVLGYSRYYKVLVVVCEHWWI